MEQGTSLELPTHLSPLHASLLRDLAARNFAEHGNDLQGLVLSGSAGRGLATERSDVDVFVILTRDGMTHRQTTHSQGVDEIPVSLEALQEVPVFGSHGWWFRWSFAWAPVLLDRTDGALQSALTVQATVSPTEAESILVEHDRLDGWLNYAYRALKNDRDGRALERRLDAAESLPWLLDVIFSMAGRVRPYHKYLPWELEHHPLPDWGRDTFLPLIESTLDGDPSAIRSIFERIEPLCEAFDRQRGRPVLRSVIDDWGDELLLLRG